MEGVSITSPSVTLQFVLADDPCSSAIAWFSQGHFSHVDAVLPDGRLLGARSDKIGGVPSGVQIRPSNYGKWVKRTQFVIPCSPTQKTNFWSFLNAQIGKSYDSRAIWAFAVNRDWRESDSWICSELQSAALETAGIWRPLYLAANKITPVMCAMVASATAGAIYEDLSQ